MNTEVYEEMFNVEDRHWWFAAKRRIVLHLLKKYAPARDEKLKVVDLGCGCGATLQRLRKHYDAIGLDSSQLAIDYCAKRGIPAEVAMLPDGLKLPSNSADVVLMLDVLEHLPDDHASLKEAIRLLKPDGIFICTVPAYQWLWSWWDEVHHHHRRYNAKTLRTLIAGSGLKVELLSYANTFLFPLAAAVRLTSRSKPKETGKSPMTVPSPFTNWMFRKIYASERHILAGPVRLPFGLSLIAVGRKVAEQQNATATPSVPSAAA